ncbi:MAG: YhdH/YhfP family quinone oxidoreductase [Lentisphaeraceae bacterium]|nr:YhdH/YhfP family quinone oxidoreductase [Lentisphaeraceae bacterium]
MGQQNFKAFVVDENEGRFTGAVQTKSIDELAEGDLLVEVHYSSLNYKDALSACGNKGVTRNFPHTPGIDAVGIVVSSSNDKFAIGDEVIVTSYDLGMNTAGGFGQFIRVPAEWAVKLPQGMSFKESMILGTAGLTAGMSVLRLIESVKPQDGKIVVSGATGGVGSLSVAILSKLGYDVAAISGKMDEVDFLKNIGASEVLARRDFEDENKRPILKGLFAGAIDTVGGTILENIIKSTQPMGVVTCCGNAASANLNLTVFPFILRGVSLVGIDSQNYPMKYREAVWEKLAGEWKPQLNAFEEITLEGLSEKIELMLAGKSKGRTLVNLRAE